MRIVCPKCDFARSVPDEKVPATAEVATCPKCQHKFKFRDIGDMPGPAATPIPEPEPVLEAGVAAEEEPDEPVITADLVDDLPHAAPRRSPMDGFDDDTALPPPPAPPARPARPADDADGDGWQRLENMGDSDQSYNHAAHDRPGADLDDDHDEEEVPWERLDTWGFFPGMFQTVKRAMLSAPSFFRRMPLGRGMAKPLVFYILISEFQAVFQYAWQMIGYSALNSMQGADMSLPPTGMAFMGFGSVAMLILYPILATIALFLSSGLNHLFLMIYRAGDSGFEGTLRAMAYGSAPMLLGAVPLVGPFAGALWTMVTTLIGYKHIHRTTYGRVALAVSTPVIMLVGLAVAAAMIS